jgi:hypothetical protein
MPAILLNTTEVTIALDTDDLGYTYSIGIKFFVLLFGLLPTNWLVRN